MKRFALIGSDLRYSQVRKVHAELGDYEYEHIEISDGKKLGDILHDTGFDGFNVTDPYRSDVIRYLDEISDDAKRTNAVNVVKRMDDGRLKGYNTDVRGFYHLVRESFEGKKCMVLGTCGAARSIAEVLREQGASGIVMVSHDPDEAAGRIGDAFELTGYDRLYPYYDAELIVNCTKRGEFPRVEESPFTEARISMRLFSRLELAIDLIYDPYRTKFLQDARRLTGCRTKSGLDMVIIQAMAAKDIWFDLEYDPGEEERIIRKVKRKLLEDQLNVVAVGLPGSGKTTIFRRYAYELGLEFIDTDEETEKLLGTSITEVLAESGIGEDQLRAAEHQVVRDVSRARGAVIATGGGTMLNPVNRDILRANGIIIYVKRPLEMLEIKGKPLSINLDLSEVFSDRERIYRRVSDITLINSRIFGEKKERTGEGNSYNYELKGFVYFVARKVQKYLNELAANEWT